MLTSYPGTRRLHCGDDARGRLTTAAAHAAREHGGGRPDREGADARRSATGRSRRGDARGRATSAVRELRRRLLDIERQIHDLEERLRGFAEVLSDPELYKDGDRVRTVATAGTETAEQQVAC